MEYSLFTKLAAEFFGTAILMIFGNGSVANVELKNTCLLYTSDAADD